MALDRWFVPALRTGAALTAAGAVSDDTAAAMPVGALVHEAALAFGLLALAAGAGLPTALRLTIPAGPLQLPGRLAVGAAE